MSRAPETPASSHSDEGVQQTLTSTRTLQQQIATSSRTHRPQFNRYDATLPGNPRAISVWDGYARLHPSLRQQLRMVATVLRIPDNTSFLDDRQGNGEAPARTTDLKVPPRQQPRTAPRRQTPAEAPPPSKFTVLLEPDAAADFDQLALDIHRLLGAGFPGTSPRHPGRCRAHAARPTNRRAPHPPHGMTKIPSQRLSRRN